MSPVRYHLGKFPPSDLEWQKLIPLIGPANAALGRYDAFLTAIPNKHILLSPLIAQEAVLSSKIEGTHVTIGEVFEYEAGSSSMPETKRGDAEEVLNYRKAMLNCVAELQNRPFSQHILRSAHSILMQGVRGKDKTPGSYRTEQNWIGERNSTIDTASFIPISPEQLQPAMDTWEHYVNDTSQPDVLVQLAIVHLEFEALHPFKDGNGRLGRMIIPLILFQRGLLQSPDFYMSGYFEANRDEYIERMRIVSRDNDWTQWCVFFLKGIRTQADENEEKARKILELYNKIKIAIAESTHSQHAIKAVDFIFRFPIFTTPLFINGSKIPKTTATRIVNVLADRGFISPLREGKGRRAGIFAFGELLNITEEGNLFVSHE